MPAYTIDRGKPDHREIPRSGQCLDSHRQVDLIVIDGISLAINGPKHRRPSNIEVTRAFTTDEHVANWRLLVATATRFTGSSDLR
jgi:hypothetical protein